MRRILMTGVALFLVAGASYCGFHAIRLFIVVGSEDNPFQVSNVKPLAIATFCLAAATSGLQGAYTQIRRHWLKPETGD